MNRWFQRARELEKKAAGDSTDKTDRSTKRDSGRDLSSVLAPCPAGALNAVNDLVSVSSVAHPCSLAIGSSADTADWHARGWIWNDLEIQMFISRCRRFMRMGLAEPEAERAADRLVARDRDGDDRRLCVECRHCRPGPSCSRGLEALPILQACDLFVLMPTYVLGTARTV